MGVSALAEMHEPKGASWFYPITIRTPYRALEAGDVVEVGEGVYHSDALVQQGIDPDSVMVLHYDADQNVWQKPAQIRIEPIGEQPYLNRGRLSFRLIDSVPPLSVSHAYALVSLPDSHTNWPTIGAPLTQTLIAPVPSNEQSQNADWHIETKIQSSLNVRAYNSDRLWKYNGQGRKSEAIIHSPQYKVVPGDVLYLEVPYQITSMPVPTRVEELPREQDIEYLGQAEQLLPRLIWRARWTDAAGQNVPGPVAWKMDRLPMEQALVRQTHLKVPARAVALVLEFEFGGPGRIDCSIGQPMLRQLTQLPSQIAYDISDSGKVTFPQYEHRRDGQAFVWHDSLTVRVGTPRSDQSDSANVDPHILLDGLRDYSPRWVNDKEAITADVVIEPLAQTLSDIDELHDDVLLKQQIETLPEEGYVLNIRHDGVTVYAQDDRGVFYGLQELGERLRLGQGKIESALVIDWPALSLRMVHHLLTWKPVDDPDTYYQQWIPRLARLRVNAIAFDAREAWYKLDKPYIQKQWQEIFALCRQWQITPVPMGFNFRNPMPVRETLQWYAANLCENEPYRLDGTHAVPLRPKVDAFRSRPVKLDSGLAPDTDGLTPVIPLLGANNPVWATDEKGQARYEMGRDFVIEGEIEWGGSRLPFSPLRLLKPFAISRTADSRIPNGSIVLLNYNYLYRQRGHHQETYSTNISEPEAFALTETALQETLKQLDPNIIHLNQDEIIGLGRDGRDRQRMAQGQTPGDLFADLLARLRQTTLDAGYQGTRMIWHDTLTPLHGGWALNYNAPYYSYDALDKIDRDWVINVWTYRRDPGRSEAMTRVFLERGFTVVGSPAETREREGVIDWCYLLNDLSREYPGQVSGIFLTSWRNANHAAYRWQRDFARYSWNPGPWTQRVGNRLRVYDPIHQPVSMGMDASPRELANIKPTVGANPSKMMSQTYWQAWKGGYISDFAWPSAGSNTIEIQLTNTVGQTTSRLITK